MMAVDHGVWSCVIVKVVCDASVRLIPCIALLPLIQKGSRFFASLDVSARDEF